jgi:hypothetical protein
MQCCNKLVLCLLLSVSPLTDAHIRPYTGEYADAVTIAFKSGSATFNLSKGIAHNIVFHVGDKSYSVSLLGCTPLEHIGFDSAIFDVGQSPEDGLFTITFDVGREADRAFGKLPRVQVSFNHGSPSLLLVNREIAKNHGFSSPLCPDRKTS